MFIDWSWDIEFEKGDWGEPCEKDASLVEFGIAFKSKKWVDAG